jgi:hypothetical protein
MVENKVEGRMPIQYNGAYYAEAENKHNLFAFAECSILIIPIHCHVGITAYVVAIDIDNFH